MMEKLRKLSAEEAAALGRLLESVPPGFPLTQKECREIAEAALVRSSLSPHAVVSRLLWLVDPKRRYGVDFLAEGRREAGEIAHTIVAPRDTIFALIRRKTGLDLSFLDRLYEEILTKGAPGDVQQIADLAEERILHEMKWWLTDLSFPDFYLRNTPPGLMARQIMLNRSHEVLGMDSEAYERMLVSSRSPDGTDMHWVHQRRSLEVEEEIERGYYAGSALVNVSAYAPLPNLLLYTVYRSPAAKAADRKADLRTLSAGPAV